MKKALVLLLLGVCLAEDLISNEKVDKIKKSGAKWNVTDPGKNPLNKHSVEMFKEMLKGNMQMHKESKLVDNEPVTEEEVSDEKANSSDEPNVDREARADSLYDKWGILKNFDGRTLWGDCIHAGGTQGTCNGCWAFGILNHLSDRFCIRGKNVILSVQDMLECTTGNNCCQGGLASNGYNYMMNTGVVAASCKSYTKRCSECRPSSCTRYKCQKNSMFWADTIQQAKREIYNNGPIELVFDVYEDFPNYASGVYYHTSTKILGVHTVEVLGWGTENGMDYWLCKNSWGSDWGDSGFFKIKIGDSDNNSALTTCQPLIS